MTATEIAQYAADAGPTAGCRPAYDSSPNGLAFLAGLWAREHGIVVHEVRASRGYTLILNRDWRIDFKKSPPSATRVTP